MVNYNALDEVYGIRYIDLGPIFRIFEIMQSDEHITKIIKETARYYFSDADVLLFGSRAKKNANEKSDYDVLIIIDQLLTPQSKTPLRTQIRKDLLKHDIRSDILIQSRTEVEKKKKLPGHLIRNIMREAILL